ncbi:MAG: hypothetical protein NWP87_06525 [Winogradskyella sp.]|nr:hypothetical protein [Winogradskyella sp.]
MKQSKLNQSIKSFLRCSIGCVTTPGIAMAQVAESSELFQILKS